MPNHVTDGLIDRYGSLVFGTHRDDHDFERPLPARTRLYVAIRFALGLDI